LTAVADTTTGDVQTADAVLDVVAGERTLEGLAREKDRLVAGL